MKKILISFLSFLFIMSSVLLLTASEALPTDIKTYSVDGITYYMYVPSVVKADTPIFVSVHGTSRNADEHASLYLPYAKSKGVISISPLFPEERYSDYQRLGQNSDADLDKVIANAKSITGTQVNKIYLSGYSGALNLPTVI